MKKTHLLLSAVLLASLTGIPMLATDAMSRPHHEGPAFDCPPDRPCAPMPCVKQLDPEQQKKYDAIMDEYTSRLEPLREALFVKRHQLSALKAASSPNLDAIAGIAKEVYRLRLEIGKIHEERAARLASEFGTPEREPRGPHGEPMKRPLDEKPAAPAVQTPHAEPNAAPAAVPAPAAAPAPEAPNGADVIPMSRAHRPGQPSGHY